jgi:hypothetical protein
VASHTQAEAVAQRYPKAEHPLMADESGRQPLYQRAMTGWIGDEGCRGEVMIRGGFSHRVLSADRQAGEGDRDSACGVTGAEDAQGRSADNGGCAAPDTERRNRCRGWGYMAGEGEEGDANRVDVAHA